MHTISHPSCSPKAGLRSWFIPTALALAASVACAQSAGSTPAPADSTQASASPDKARATLPEVTIRNLSGQRDMRPGALRDEMVMTESVSARAMERSGATNINEAVDKHPGVAVQVECSICNVRNVLLNNLPGRYTTVMLEGVPIYSSLSSAYGLDSIGLYGAERIDIARGAGASLIAPEALAGTVNLVMRRPSRDEAQLRVQAGRFSSRQVDAFAAKPLAGGALTASIHGNHHASVDGNGDGISEYTGYKRHMGGIGWFADDVGGFRLRGRLDVVDEKRNGGALGRNYARIMESDSGNPFDFSRGPHGSPNGAGWINPEDGSFMPYDGGLAGFSEIIFTKRQQFITTGERHLGGGRLRLSVGAANHKQESFYEGAIYNARQKQYYADANYQWKLGDWLMTGGASYRYEDLRSHGSTEEGEAVSGIDNYTFRVPALYLQGWRSFLGDRLELNASLRLDHHNTYGNILSPRANLLYHHSPHLSSRLSAGKGFRAPTSFFEQDHGILNTIRIQRDVTKPEVSHNLSYALNYSDDRLALTTSYNYNRIRHMAMLDADAQDAQGRPLTIFSSAREPVTVQGVDVNMSWQATPSTVLSAGAELYHYRFHPGALAFARPNARAFFSADYESGPWSLNAKLNLTGPMNLKKFHGDGAEQGRYNFDGTPKKDRSPTFATLDARVQYAIGKNASIYLGVDNLLNYTQAKKESFLWIDGEGGYDVTHLWGPNRGRFVYVGAKFEF